MLELYNIFLLAFDNFKHVSYELGKCSFSMMKFTRILKSSGKFINISKRAGVLPKY